MKTDMKNNFNDLEKNMTLTPEERSRMQRTIRSYMEMKPIRSAQHVARAWSIAPYFSPRLISGALVAALFASSAGISYAAQGSLPGDWLYGVKVNINEPVQGALATSAQAKSDWAITVASTRLQEAATLAAEGKLSTSTQEDLKQNFDEHATVAAQIIAQQASTSPDTGATSAISFEAQLSEYQQVLAEVGQAKDVQTDTIASAVRSAQQTVGTIRASAEARAAATSSAPGLAIAASRMRDIAREQLTASLALSKSEDGSLATSSAAQVAIQLSDASDTIAAGEQLLNASATPEARGAFQSALSAAQKLNVFLQTSSAIHEKTGLTIGESATTTQRTGIPAIIRAALTNRHDGKNAAPVAALKVFTASTTTTTAATSSATTTSDEDSGSANVSTQTTVTSGSDNSGSGGNADTGSQSSGPELPISVPQSIFQH